MLMDRGVAPPGRSFSQSCCGEGGGYDYDYDYDNDNDNDNDNDGDGEIADQAIMSGFERFSSSPSRPGEIPAASPISCGRYRIGMSIRSPAVVGALC